MSSQSNVNENWDWAMMEPELTAREKLLRDHFVNEYLVDYEPVLAAQRVGFQQAFAKDYAKKFMGESYVQKRITALEQADIDTDAIDAYDKKRIKARLMREAHYEGPGATHAGRVSALAKLMALYGMDAPVKTEQPETHKGGVMTVPAIADVNSWEQAAVASQEKLISDVRH